MSDDQSDVTFIVLLNTMSNIETKRKRQGGFFSYNQEIDRTKLCNVCKDEAINIRKLCKQCKTLLKTGKCEYCGVLCNGTLTKDHVVSLSRGGNVVVNCCPNVVFFSSLDISLNLLNTSL